MLPSGLHSRFDGLLFDRVLSKRPLSHTLRSLADSLLGEVLLRLILGLVALRVRDEPSLVLLVRAILGILVVVRRGWRCNIYAAMSVHLRANRGWRLTGQSATLW